MPRHPDSPVTPRRSARARRVRVALIVVGVVAVVLTIAALVWEGPRLVGDERERGTLAEFYRQPLGATIGLPGTIVRSEALEGELFDARAWRVMYRTTDLNGVGVIATGVVVVPRGTAPAGGRRVLAWGHPTTGTAKQCAPSRSLDPYLDVEGIRVMLDRGYTVVATDYVGMGTDGPNSYLVGVTAAHSVLDSVRAARDLLGTTNAGSSVVLWGHSQGGQAALFAAEQAATYAPELEIEAVAVAAPAANLTALLKNHLDDVSGVTIGSYAFDAFSQVYATRGAQLSQVLTDDGQRVVPLINRLCLLAHISELHEIARSTVANFVAVDMAKAEPWAALLAENSAGSKAFDAPLFVAQGLKDELVLPADTNNFVDHEKRLGMTVTYEAISIADHATIAYLALPALSEWLDSLNL